MKNFYLTNYLSIITRDGCGITITIFDTNDQILH